jgi:hypothetical protein
MDALARLVAIEEIKQLKARYFRLMDTRDFDGMALVFCKNAFFDCTEGFGAQPLDGPWKGEVGPIQRGRANIIKWIRESFAKSTSTHHGHCHEITIDNETEAHGIIAMEDYIRGTDRETKIVHATGHYHEDYRFEDGAWRIARTKLTRLFSDFYQPMPK